MSKWKPLYWLLRLVFGGLFIYASLDKILHPSAFAEIIYNYQILPGAMINLTAIILPWLELVIGILLVAGKFMPGAVAICNLLLAGFWASLLFNMIRGLDINCGCFSTQSAEHSSMIFYLFRDTAFLGMGILLFVLTLRNIKRETLLEAK